MTQALWGTSEFLQVLQHGVEGTASQTPCRDEVLQAHVCQRPPGLEDEDQETETEDMKDDGQLSPAMDREAEEEEGVCDSFEQALVRGLKCPRPWQWWWAVTYKIMQLMKTTTLDDIEITAELQAMAEKHFFTALEGIAAMWETLGTDFDDTLDACIQKKRSEMRRELTQIDDAYSLSENDEAGDICTSNGMGLFAFGAVAATASPIPTPFGGSGNTGVSLLGRADSTPGSTSGGSSLFGGTCLDTGSTQSPGLSGGFLFGAAQTKENHATDFPASSTASVSLFGAAPSMAPSETSIFGAMQQQRQLHFVQPCSEAHSRGSDGPVPLRHIWQ